MDTRASSERAPAWADLLFGRYAPATWTLCLGVGTHAINWFLVATAVPSVVLDIGGAAQVSWVSALYLVFSIVGSAAGGDLRKRFGGRGTFAVAALVLAAASMLAAEAPGFPAFLVARSLQGLAEGTILALCFILVAEVFPSRAQPSVFSLLAVVWAVATIAAPIMAGTLTTLVSWRLALWSVVPLAAGLVALALAVVPREAGRREPSPGIPAVRLSLLLFGALAVCVAGEVEAGGLGGGLVVASLALFVGGLALDHRAERPLLPRGLLAPVAAAPIGLWIIGLMMFAETGLVVFAAYVAQVGFAQSPLIAGQIASIPALAWSAAAIAVARLGPRRADRSILAGPLSLGLGLAINAAAVAAMQLPWFLVGLVLCGTGFGVSHGFLNQRIMAKAGDGEAATTSGAIPTFEGIGSAFGAAAAGLVAARAGFDGTAGSVSAVWAVFAVGAGVGVVALALAARFVRLTRGI
jgi:MFS family permease